MRQLSIQVTICKSKPLLVKLRPSKKNVALNQVTSYKVAYLPDDIRILVFSQILTGICDTMKIPNVKQYVEMFRL